MKYTAFFDGSAQPNPGIKRIGGRILYNGTVIVEFNDVTGRGTNNEAEYEALLKLSEIIKKQRIKEIDIYGDSQLVVNQINKIWKCTKPNLIPLLKKIQENLSEINYTLRYIPREQNSESDKLSKRGIL